MRHALKSLKGQSDFVWPRNPSYGKVCQHKARDQMPTRNISLTDRLDRFVETSVSTGRYQNASEVVREGLRLLEYRHQEDMLKLRHLRKAIQEGEDALAHDGYRGLDVDELREFLASLGVTGGKRAGS
jgi:antitoxin ParD1/3/4